MSAAEGDDLEGRCAAALAQAGADNPLTPLLSEALERMRSQQQLLDRLVRISDKSQKAERERGLTYLASYQKKIRQIEKIVRISDQYQFMMRDLNERLVRASTHDALTGLPNRRFMQDRLAGAVAQSSRDGGSFALALIDIDFFKRINDTFGHGVGDAVLVHVAASFKALMREYDVCCRWGGEEFLVLFSGVGLTDAVALAERLRGGIAVHPDHPADMPPVTVSIGVAVHRPGEDVEHCIQRADEALYRAKHQGRNCVVTE